MKRFWIYLFAAMVAVMVSVGGAWANGPVSARNSTGLPYYMVGNDAHYQAADLEQFTPGWKPGMKFYVARHENRWDPKEGQSRFEMKKVGNEYIAPNVFNKRHHPVLPGQVWFKIEDAYPDQLPDKGQFENGIDYTNTMGPCFLMGDSNAKPFNKGGK